MDKSLNKIHKTTNVKSDYINYNSKRGMINLIEELKKSVQNQSLLQNI